MELDGDCHLSSSMASLGVAENPCDPNTEARRVLDIEIAQLEARLLSLRRSRNALAPISRIHSEILQEIFAFTSHTSTHQGKATLLLTWISHDWRDLAIQTSTIWTHIDFTNPEWVELSLSRTHNRELEFSINSISDAHQLDQGRIRALIPLCFGNLSRMKTIRLLFGVEREINTPRFPPYRQEWQSPAPVLEELKLSGVFLPSSLFSGTCPALQILDLSICAVDWATLPAMPNLRALHLESFPTLIPLRTMVQILTQIGDGLEILKLRHVFDQPLPPQANPDTVVGRVHLPNLEHLDVQELFNGSIIKQFLDTVSLPDYLDASFASKPWDNASVAKAFLEARGASEWDIAVLRGEGRHGVLRLRITESWSYGNSDTEAEENDQLSSSSHSTEEMFTSVTTFYLGSQDDVEVGNMFEYFGGLGTVLALVLDPSLFLGFLTWITRQVDQLEATQTLDGDMVSNQYDEAALRSIIPFHNLFRLAMNGEIGSNSEMYRERDPGLRMEDIELLRKWLMWRKRAGLEVDMLTINAVKIPALSILEDAFRDLVGEMLISDIMEENGHTE